MERRLPLIILAIFLNAQLMNAQFTSSGNDPAYVRWNSIQGNSYRVIYPSGLDSLGKVYSEALERFSVPVSASIGFLPNQNYRKPHPVVLHAYNSSPNGLVAWTPRRMELYTVPDAYEPEPLPWVTELAIHESRHVAQMQFANHRGRKFWQILTGELAAGAFAALYPGPAFFEGDAVAAETGLSSSGRGRCADFLEYYMVSFDKGDFRDWYKWRYGSQKYYTPDYYRVGYMTIAGMRTLYDEPLFTKRYYDRMFRFKAFNVPFFNMQHTVKDVSGKNFKETFRDIEQYFQDTWEKETIERGPFMPSEKVSATPRRFESLTGSTLTPEGILSVRTSIALPRGIVGQDGKDVCAFAGSTSSLMWSEPLGRLFWSESIPDPRWELKSTSTIRYMEPDSRVKHNLTEGGRYFNPAPSLADERIAAVEYPYDGTTSVTVLDGRDGHELARYPAPDSLQAVEVAWSEAGIAVSAISEQGFGIYLADSSFRTLLPPQPVKVKQLRSSKDGKVLFVCDRTGVNELYRLDVNTLELEKISNTLFGASDFVFSGDSLYYSVLSPESRGLYRTATPDLPVKKVDFSEIHHYPIADKLSAQEKALSAGYGDTASSEPEKYSKAGHLFHVHSWAPVFFNYDDILDLSFDQLYLSAGAGATVLFQNELGTMYGSAAYGVHKDPDREGGPWKHSGHAKFTYSGLYPVFEGKLDFNDRDAREYYRMKEEGKSSSFYYSLLDKPAFDGSLTMYVPLNFSSGGWSRGIIPQVKYSLSNNVISRTEITYRYVENPDGTRTKEIVSSDIHDPKVMQQLVFGVRGYTMRPTASSGVYPRWGIGAELMVREWLGINELVTPNLGAYLYGYVPGIIPQHGLKLTATYQTMLNTNSLLKNNYLSVLPRGFSYGALSSFISGFPMQMKFTADYAMAFAPVDWSFLCPAAYIRNFELTAHMDYAEYGGNGDSAALCSVGADLVARLGNFLWIPYNTRIGVSYSYNGGRSFAPLSESIPLGRNSFSLIFSIDL